MMTETFSQKIESGEGSYDNPFKLAFKSYDHNGPERLFVFGSGHWILSSQGDMVKYRPSKYCRYFYEHLKTKKRFHLILRDHGFSHGVVPNAAHFAEISAKWMVRVFPELFRIQDEFDFTGFINALKDDLGESMRDYKDMKPGNVDIVKKTALLKHVERVARTASPLLKAQQGGAFIGRNDLETCKVIPVKGGKSLLRRVDIPEAIDITDKVEVDIGNQSSKDILD